MATPNCQKKVHAGVPAVSRVRLYDYDSFGEVTSWEVDVCGDCEEYYAGDYPDNIEQVRSYR